jgi:hypothetical protein
VKRELSVGTYVKMNPFLGDEAYRAHSSRQFEGERKITGIDKDNGPKGDWYKVEGSNWWKAMYLLVKGEDYDVEGVV